MWQRVTLPQADWREMALGGRSVGHNQWIVSAFEDGSVEPRAPKYSIVAFPEEGSSKFLRNFVICVPNHTTSLSRRQHYLQSQPWGLHFNTFTSNISFFRRHFLLQKTFPSSEDICFFGRHLLLQKTFPSSEDISFFRRHFLLQKTFPSSEADGYPNYPHFFLTRTFVDVSTGARSLCPSRER